MNVGDIVRLNNGGPKMVVEAFKADANCVVCIWFTLRPDGTWDGLFRDRFPISLLVRLEAA